MPNASDLPATELDSGDRRGGIMWHMDALEIMRQLQQDPALKAQLRTALLGEEILSLPELVRENSRQIAENSRQIAALTERMGQVETQIASLAKRVDSNIVHVLEMKFYQRVEDYCDEVVDNAKVLRFREIDALLARTSPAIRDKARRRLRKADAVVDGKRAGSTKKVTAVVEISSVVGIDDVERAVAGAALLEEAGVNSLAVVAGESCTDEASERCEAGEAVFLEI